MENQRLDSGASTWDAAADWYDQAVSPNTARYAADALESAQLRPGERVLDVAAGTGAFALLAAERGAHVVATDYAPLMVERLTAKAAKAGLASKIEARVMDGQRLDLPNASFDVAASVFGLIFFPDRLAGLREMRRVLRAGGRAVLTTWSVPARVRAVGLVGDALREVLPDLPAFSQPPPIFSMADPKRIEAEGLDAGFSRVTVRSVTKTWTYGSPEQVWTELAPSSPVFKEALAGLDDVMRAKVRDNVLAHAKRAMRGGVVELPSEAHIARLDV